MMIEDCLGERKLIEIYALKNREKLDKDIYRQFLLYTCEPKRYGIERIVNWKDGQK